MNSCLANSQILSASKASYVVWCHGYVHVGNNRADLHGLRGWPRLCHFFLAWTGVLSWQEMTSPHSRKVKYGRCWHKTSRTKTGLCVTPINSRVWPALKMGRQGASVSLLRWTLAVERGTWERLHTSLLQWFALIPVQNCTRYERLLPSWWHHWRNLSSHCITNPNN